MKLMRLVVGIIVIIILILLLRVGELYTQLARYQRYWDKVNQKPVAKNELVYVAFGDSAAQGIGASKPENGYVGLIAKSLAAENNRPVHVINLSKSGANINDVINTQLPKYKELDIKNNQIITIDIGANDVVRSDLQNFEKEIDKLMSELPKNAVIADIPSFKGSRFARLEPRVNKANEIMYKLAEKHGFELVSVHDNSAGSHSLRTFGADFFHPSNYGYEVNWASVFLKRINSFETSM